MKLGNVHLDQFEYSFHLFTLPIAKELVHYEERLKERSQVDEEYIRKDSRCAPLKHAMPNELCDPPKCLNNEVEVELTHAKIVGILIFLFNMSGQKG